MKILAIDPGNEQSAFVCWDGNKIQQANILKNDQFFCYDFGENIVSIEMIASYGMPVGKTVFETCLWIGRFMERFKPERVQLVYRKDIKIHFCHSMKAKDCNIRQALIDRLGEPGTKKNPGKTYGISKDMWSALAIALYTHDRIISSNSDRAFFSLPSS